jgi:hypothetical protein
MKRSTILLLVVAVLVAAVLYYLWRKPEQPAPGPAPGLVQLFPADADYVFYADAAALRASPFVRQLLTLLPDPGEDRDYQNFVRETGFDYSRDLDRVALATLPPARGADSHPADAAVVAFADGRFDRAKIAAYVLRSGRQIQLQNLDAYQTAVGKPPRTITLAFLSESRTAVAEGADLAGVLSAQRPSAPTPLEERIARVAASELFAVLRVDSLPKGFLPEGWVSGEIRETLRGIRWLTLAARPAGESLTVVLEAESETPGNARKLSWGLEGLRVLLRMAKPEGKTDPAAAALLETIARDAKISSADRYTRITLTLTPQFLAAAQGKSPHAPANSSR